MFSFSALKKRKQFFQCTEKSNKIKNNINLLHPAVVAIRPSSIDVVGGPVLVDASRFLCFARHSRDLGRWRCWFDCHGMRTTLFAHVSEGARQTKQVKFKSSISGGSSRSRLLCRVAIFFFFFFFFFFFSFLQTGSG